MWPSARVNSQSIQIKTVEPPPKFETFYLCLRCDDVSISDGQLTFEKI